MFGTFLPCNHGSRGYNCLTPGPRRPAFRPVLAFPLSVETFRTSHLTFFPSTLQHAWYHRAVCPTLRTNSSYARNSILLVRVASHVAILTLVCAVGWADFPIVGISKAQTPEGRVELAPVMRDAMRTYGFMYVVNHGLSQAQVSVPRPSFGIAMMLILAVQNNRMVDIADIPFTQVSEEDKQHFASKTKETGSYGGFKPHEF